MKLFTSRVDTEKQSAIILVGKPVQTESHLPLHTHPLCKKRGVGNFFV